ncbi:sulfur carrier protein ThiS [Anaerostipes caccae L1-92]|uniref:Thiamine biosynthesis protein ThiS n=1 Tax=Anaerostipes caccae (strain DSM 14662 / CCUG 47493 / JCM 13470 / NCIMB 13811 / L1-92) TaxID=411490 RepID=B0MIY9_ANACD|nr:sulfur carrier protein ThiS [Anaerostipes caccae]EDR95919.1 thiamine biosynthesis protein ThiS [Anaerostipes caccae L1-92]UWN72779.1 sulfur carrier protein ThiS [Anaerostipes caccae L1-92]
MMRVNGKERCLEAGRTTLKQFLLKEGYRLEHIAVERNGEIAPKAEYETIMLTEADTLEIVSFVGGG